MTTRKLARTKPVIVIEDLSVAGMLKNQKLARPICDVGWSEFVRMVEYKAKWYGSVVVKAPRFYPSSKRCCECGYVAKEMSLDVREWACHGSGSDGWANRIERFVYKSQNGKFVPMKEEQIQVVLSYLSYDGGVSLTEFQRSEVAPNPEDAERESG